MTSEARPQRISALLLCFSGIAHPRRCQRLCHEGAPAIRGEVTWGRAEAFCLDQHQPSNIMNEPPFLEQNSWNRILQLQWSLQTMAALFDMLTLTSCTTSSQMAQLRYSWIPNSQELGEIFTIYCCFKLMSLGTICYSSIDTIYTHNMKKIGKHCFKSKKECNWTPWTYPAFWNILEPLGFFWHSDT